MQDQTLACSELLPAQDTDGNEAHDEDEDEADLQAIIEERDGRWGRTRGHCQPSQGLSPGLTPVS